MGEKDILCCTVKTVTFYNPENGYAVLRVNSDDTQKQVTAVGTIEEVTPGTGLQLEGNWEVNKHYGKQFAFTNWKVEVPSSMYGLELFLGGGLIKGIGPKLAKKIVARFQDETRYIIEHDPLRLTDIKDVGKKRAQLIHESWSRWSGINLIMEFLHSVHISPKYALKIYERYGQDSIKNVRLNPYRLADEIVGFGFKKADKIAEELGIEKNSPFRVRCGIKYVLSALSEQGHVCFPEEQLLPEAATFLEVTEEDVKDAYQKLLYDGSVISQKGMAYVASLYMDEKKVAERVLALSTRPSKKIMSILEAEEIGSQLGVQYDEAQAEAIADAMGHGLMVLTGGPGTGKTTTVKGILAAFRRKGKTVLLAAPTGRAAKRMEELTGAEAKTIHRLLEYRGGTWGRNEEAPLEGDALILDECSMIDISLMARLLEAVPEEMSVVMVGDVDQLPPVGPGNVLKDIIDSGVCEIRRLTHVFRQALESNIIVNAHKVNKGLPLQIDNSVKSDFFYMEQTGVEPGDVSLTITDLVSRRLPAKFGIQPIHIQVLSPMRKGPAGVDALNVLLQQALNPGTGGVAHSGIVFRKGDKVMQLHNDYDNEVFNGDIGYVVNTNENLRTVTVNFDGKDVEYEYGHLDDISHAYATTIHKSQGSEYEVVVMPLLTSHYVMLQRNLLYTGITRAKKMFVLIEEKKALFIAVDNQSVAERYGCLVYLLRQSRLYGAGKVAV